MLTTGPFTRQDIDYMRQALDLARNGEGRVSPNPPVGCVLVKDGRIVGRGWHNRLGDLHAEAMALQDAGQQAKDAVAYVTLSPCATHGRQPPCAEALIRAGVAEVIAAAEDPNPKNASGLDVLRAAGVPVRSGLLRDDAEYLAKGFFKMMRRRMPYLTLKYAMTLDGKIATASGDSRWISGPESRELVQDMRSRSDAILVGSGTALADNPLLNVREPVLSRRGGIENHPQPLRVITDSRCGISPQAALFDSAQPGGKVLVAAVDGAEPARIRALEQAGAEVLLLSSRDGKVPLTSLLEELGKRGINQILCEGGGELAAGLLSQSLVDEVVAFVAAKAIGGQNAPGPVGNMGLEKMAQAIPLRFGECKTVGDDIFIRAFV